MDTRIPDGRRGIVTLSHQPGWIGVCLTREDVVGRRGITIAPDVYVLHRATIRSLAVDLVAFCRTPTSRQVDQPRERRIVSGQAAALEHAAQYLRSHLGARARPRRARRH